MSTPTEIQTFRELLALKDREIDYLRKIACDAGNQRLRETEELSRLNAILKSKMAQLEEQRLELQNLYDRIEQVSVTDELTGLLNRRGIMLQAENVFHTFKRQLHLANTNIHPELGFTCVILDIDHFKSINDRYGHLAGDKILMQLGEIIRTAGLFRMADIVGRYGGEEFMIILPGSTTDRSLRPIEILYQKIRQYKFAIDTGEKISVTVSIGISQADPRDNNFDCIFRRADQALYAAKSSGRDRIEMI